MVYMDMIPYHSLHIEQSSHHYSITEKDFICTSIKIEINSRLHPSLQKCSKTVASPL